MAQKEQIFVRVTPSEKNKILRFAKADGRTISGWIARVIDQFIKQAEKG